MWLKIHTAPLDGRCILTCVAGQGYERYETSISVCWWKLDAYEGDRWQNDADSEPAPTHWCPLPAAPAETRDLTRWRGAFEIPEPDNI